MRFYLCILNLTNEVEQTNFLNVTTLQKYPRIIQDLYIAVNSRAFSLFFIFLIIFFSLSERERSRAEPRLTRVSKFLKYFFSTFWTLYVDRYFLSEYYANFLLITRIHFKSIRSPTARSRDYNLGVCVCVENIPFLLLCSNWLRRIFGTNCLTRSSLQFARRHRARRSYLNSNGPVWSIRTFKRWLKVKSACHVVAWNVRSQTMTKNLSVLHSA